MYVSFMRSSYYVFFFKQKTAYEMRISDWSSDVCSSDLSYARGLDPAERAGLEAAAVGRLRAVLGPGVWASYLAMESEISPARVADNAQIGRASCRERVCQYG